MNHPRTARTRARKRREGVVLLITAFMLVIISATAFFAIQQGVWEMRAAGANIQAVRTRYVSESFVMGGLACVETSECLKQNPASDSWRAEYGIPDTDDAATEPMYEVRPTDFTASMGFTNDMVQTDDILSGGGMASLYEPDYRFVVEEWKLTEGSPSAGTRSRIRYVASCYAELNVTGDVTHAGELRSNNESISVSRAYYQTTK